MGGGSWTTDKYNSHTRAKIDTGTTFGYDDKARRTGDYTPHKNLDPRIVAKNGIIESRDSEEHPNSLPILIGLDQTGSMGKIPRELQKGLNGIFDLIVLRGYAEDPQISISAYGDLKCDPARSAVQISNFESDNRIDDNLDNLMLPGYGGGNGGETMSGIFYMMSKIRTDAWEKRGKKGYAFFVADEISLDLTMEDIADFTDDKEPTAPLEFEALAKEISKQWEVFILVIDNMSARYQNSIEFYTNIFGQRNVLVLEDPNAVPETIAVTIGLLEGTIDAMTVDKDLRSIGTSDSVIETTNRAIERSGLTNRQVANATTLKPVVKNKTNRL